MQPDLVAAAGAPDRDVKGEGIMLSKHQSKQPEPVSTTNACKLCTPLGACLAFRGIEGAVPLLHGSQGCATYIRRYVISHFKEPVDVASSNFSESSAIFGGGTNLNLALKNVTAQYRPKLIGVASTCLSETIGDDVSLFLHNYRREHPEAEPVILNVSTPSYRGTHIDGFHAVVRTVVGELADGGSRLEQVNLLPGMVSPADLRYLKDICHEFGVEPVLLPDYSETLDGPNWEEYQIIAPGGTTLDAIRGMGRSLGTVEFGATLDPANTGGAILRERFGVPDYKLGFPIGVRATDQFFQALEEISGHPVPERYRDERGRLLDAYVDGHKYLFGQKALLYGEEDLVCAMAGFLAEVGMIPVLCASGGESGRLEESIYRIAPELQGRTTVISGADFSDIAALAETLQPQLMIGHSKGYSLARRLEIPLVRIGFPIHDRVGGPRLLHLGYRGTQELFDRIVNALLEADQNRSPVGYSYL